MTLDEAICLPVDHAETVRMSATELEPRIPGQYTPFADGH